MGTVTTATAIAPINALGPRRRTAPGMAPPSKRQRHDGAGRLAELRQLMVSEGIAAYIVPSDDPHQSEYVAPCFERRAFISGFTGSSGTAVITATDALLWTDGRYFLQAESELFSGWELVKDRLPETVPIEVWLASNLSSGAVVGVDSFLVPQAQVNDLWTALRAVDVGVRLMSNNLVDSVWGDARPPFPCAPLFNLDEDVAGQTVGDKVAAAFAALDGTGADSLIVTALDEVAWLFNIRGADIDYCPVFYAYALLRVAGAATGGSPLYQASLFVDQAKVSADVLARVRISAGDRVQVMCKAYGDIQASIKAEVEAHRRVFVPSSSCALIHSLVPLDQKASKASPVSLLKAHKNADEIAGMRTAHLRDARAVVRFLAWLERTDGGRLPEGIGEGGKGRECVDEVEAAEVLEGFRKREHDYVGPSFETISAYGSNGAIIHYKPERATCKRLGNTSLFLCDSGGQYSCGTTDVTRTVHLHPAAATEHESACWTYVLQAHIACDTAVFPEGVTGYQLDAVARAPLWKRGLDYRHGTGHGVGAFLNVHEGPHGMSISRISTNEVPLQEGMTLSNEPGYYEDGKFGIRLENVMVVRAVPTEHTFGGKKYLGFEHLTVVPFQRELVRVDLLTAEELKWVNEYHAECLRKLTPELDGEELEWLKKACAPL